ncbi:PAS domain S-box protein [Leptolyngbya sp. 'hensonii']|uniref:response regulator n=1 Tax=Leptolyngbya sp. 'hensonii' TaxID=1922337 RepID=UPI00094F949C|nr:response regulator [Leptolyngbya sp. 'hensonii']OLP17399.1 PAS domain S-box protein [Leptolyngbya sp. 'hensonii']
MVDPLTILLVDDSQIDRTTYRRYLESNSQYEYQLIEAETGQDALSICQIHLPDVILLDYCLPEMDGLEFLDQLGQQYPETQLPVLMLTAYGNVAIAVECIKQGAQDYLDKDGLDPNLLRDRVQRILDQARLQRNLVWQQQQQQLINSIALKIRQTLDLQTVLQTATVEIQQFLKVDRVLAYQFSPEMTGTIVAESVAAGWTVSINQQIEDTCFQTGGGVEYAQGRKRAIANIEEAGLTECHVDMLRRYEVKANLVVPILLCEGVDRSTINCIGPLWGLLIAHHCQAPRPWQDAELNLLDQLAVHLSIAIQQAELYQQTRQELAERLRAEADLRQLNQELEQRVQERTAQLARTNHDLRAEVLKGLQIQEHLTEQSQLLDLAHDTIMARTLDGRILFWNQGGEQTYGWTKAEAIGQVSHILLQTCFPQPLEELEALLLAQEYWQGELIHTAKDGTPITVDSRWVLQRDGAGNPVKILEINNDINERKRVEEQIRISAERTSLANAEMARAARLKDEFLAAMSHELRTPLNAILGMSEGLLEEIYGGLTQGQRDSLRVIEQSGEHLLALINDILDLSKVESGKMDLEIGFVQVQDLCETSLNFVRQQAHQKRIHLSYELTDNPDEIALDYRRIRQVLINLLSNAIKFTSEGGRVLLTVRLNLDQEAIEFIVADTGIGIAAADMGKLFQPFVQLDSSLSRRYTGTGLGLALVRRIVELHGGSIALTSEIGKGSCFTVILPRQVGFAVPQGVPAPPSSTPLDGQLQQALVVEDSEAAANQVSRYLAELGAIAIVHPIGEGVVDMAISTQPDVIILDILLPDRSGWDVLMELKANPATAAIPVIVISVVDERSHGLALGATDYLLKPITREHLQTALNRILRVAGKTEDKTALVVAPNRLLDLPLILLAEDNEATIVMTLDYLQANGARVAIARNGLEAVQFARQYKPVLILMDIQMPEMDGLEAIRQIRLDPELKNMPIIALTALAMPGDRDRCFSAGANEYLAKPVSLKQLLRIIKQFVKTLPIP